MTTGGRHTFAPTAEADRRHHPREVAVSAALREETLHGLRSVRKTLSPKLFYDATGAQLFERITQLPEYYPTRAELEILADRSPEIASVAGSGAALIEYGSGAGIKVRTLLDALPSPAAYVPIDISAEQLARVAQEIRSEYPGLQVLPLNADFTQPLLLPPLPQRAMRLAFYPGSTIGNFHPDEAVLLLRRICNTVGEHGALVLGVDRVKDPAIIEAAYNDATGVTAAFNLNVLRRLNREFGADFDLERFSHRAFFNRELSRIETHLVSLDDQVVRVAGHAIPFAAGETIWTASSYKYDEAGLERLATCAGFSVHTLWTDSAEHFWVALLR
jgi:dimethylhistidine N-methyltransferase